MNKVMRAILDFLKDFFIGDAPEFVVVTIAVVVLAFVLSSYRVAGVVVLPLVVACSVAASAWRVKNR